MPGQTWHDFPDFDVGYYSRGREIPQAVTWQPYALLVGLLLIAVAWNRGWF